MKIKFKIILLNITILLFTGNTTTEKEIDAIINKINANKPLGIFSRLKNDFIGDASLMGLIGAYENKLFIWNRKLVASENHVLFWEGVWESILIEVTVKMFFKIFNDLLDIWGINLDENNIYKIINSKNFKHQKLIIGVEEKEELNNILNLIQLRTKAHSNHSVVYVRGNAGVGKTSNLMKLFVENNYTIYYINASNILFGRYESTNVVSTLYELWLNIAAAARKNKKVIIIIDECESVIKNTEDKVVNLPNGLLEHELSKNRNTLEKALTNFIKYICAQGIAPTIFIGNDCYDEKGQLNIDNSMCRRFNYIWNMSLPSLKTLVNIWSKYLKIYKVTISDHEQEEAAFYLGKYCQENKISIRTIVQITAVLKNSSISVKDLCVLIS